MRSQAPLFHWKSVQLAISGLLFVISISGSSGEESTKPDRLTLDALGRAQKIQDIDGNTITPLAPESGHLSLLLFTATECPIANAFSPEVSRIAKEFAAKNITVFLVYTDPELDEKSIRKHVEDFSLRPVVPILDKEQRLAQATGATHTPEASIIDSSGRQLYRGRINNRFAALGKARRVITEHDLRAALDAIVQGKPVDTPRTKVIGCYIPTPLTPSKN